MAYTVYGFTGSTYVRTVRMILAEKGVPYELVSVNQRLVNPMLEQPVDEQVVEQCLPEVKKIGQLIDAALGRSEYLAGPELSLADLYLAPPTAYLSMTEEGKALLAEQSRYNRWWEAIQARRSFQETPFQ